jgi:hypothetical protein
VVLHLIHIIGSAVPMQRFSIPRASRREFHQGQTMEPGNAADQRSGRELLATIPICFPS